MDDGRSPRNTPKGGEIAAPVDERDTVCDELSPFAEPPTRREPTRREERPETLGGPGRKSSSGVRSVELAFDLEDVAPTAITKSGETSSLDLDDDEDIELLAPGSVIDGRYVLDRMIGHGATGVVYEATHRLLGTRLALMCLHRQMSTSHVAVERLIREARIAAGLQHPNVVLVLDAGRDKDLYYLTMELLTGEPLDDWLASRPRSVEEIVSVFLSIMDGVAKVHGAGVVHRDLKPENVVVTVDDEGKTIPKVLDFGVSKLHEPGRNGPLTALGITMGTPYYMAPEQFSDTRSVDARADVYSLGIMLYEALANDVPYPGETIVEIFNKAVQGRPTPLRELRPDVPPSLETVIARAMGPDKETRYGSVKELRDALAAVALDGSDRTDDTHAPEPWMLGQGTAAGLAPLEGQPTKPNERLVARTVEMAPAMIPDAPAARTDRKALVLMAAVFAALVLGAFGLGSVIVWLLL